MRSNINYVESCTNYVSIRAEGPCGPGLHPQLQGKGRQITLKSLSKIDLGVGVYRNEKGKYNELDVLQQAKKILTMAEVGHDYEVTTGNAEFVENACRVLFGAESEAVETGRIASAQAISGTGSIHLAALFLSRAEQFKGKKVHVGAPAWGNYEPLFNLVGFEVVKYRHYDAERGVVAFSDLLKAVDQAPNGSMFVLQGCCHNPSGADLSSEQWQTLARAMKTKGHFPFFDMAYQGLGASLVDDAFGPRCFAKQGLELLACQSFSKNFGLYGERCGVLHILTESEAVAANVYDQLRCLIRWEFSSSPAYGSRLVNTILKDASLTSQWEDELVVMRERLGNLRRTLYDLLTKKQKTPGKWDAILTSTGLFCSLPLTPQHYLSDLQAKLARLQNTQHASSVSNPLLEDNHDGRDRTDRSHSPEEAPRRTAQSSGGGNLTNPLTETPSRFMAASNGRTFYMGTSSNWSFHGQVLSLVHEHIHKSPLPAADLLFDGSAYDLPWDGTRHLPESASPVIPSVDHAIFLINAVKFHCAQMMHLFEEEEFMSNLHTFYSSTGDKTVWKESLWYIHFLIIIAFGKTFVQQKHHSLRPPGADFFIHALQLLPDTNRLCRDPIVATEVLCCIALYLQSLDSRNAAHVTIGQAMRIALIQGMHTDMPVMNLGEAVVQRCRKIWWTIFILDRHMTALMGLPQSIRDEDVSCQLPNYSSSPQRAAALNIQIKLAEVHTDIASTVYGSKGRLRRKFVLSIKTVLDKLSGLAEELRTSFPLHADERFGGISRLPAHSHLYYYQTIVIVTRPLLFCCMKKVFESQQQVVPLISSPKIRKVLHMSLEASQKILSILESLQDQGLLETFLPWDLDALFVSTTVLIVTRFVDLTLLDDRSLWLEKAFALMEIMIAGGNRIANHRIRELRRLDEMLAEYAAIQERQPLVEALNQQQFAQLNTNIIQTAAGVPNGPSIANPIFTSPEGGPLYSSFSDEGSGFGDDLTAEQILAVAESLDIEGTDWLSFEVFDNYQPLHPLDMVDPSIQ
ncbi:hypothetical protein E8E12_011155 [Didymella heteroderae]|uniref:Xylanolytic transcriptional activator regulatory domain-containing protein n=1 Tax=Didymella heteroderae TaxID=1769908 RepID=A0A9P4WY14_9PLEO|nr:hypothetical protein E8E12_011155 [Didymella heteroderae]